MYSYTYRRGKPLTDQEIDQQAAEQAELEAAKEAVVNFYEDTESGEIVTFCPTCAAKIYPPMRLIDKAGDWDICGACDAQNIPKDYHGGM